MPFLGIAFEQPERGRETKYEMMKKILRVGVVYPSLTASFSLSLTLSSSRVIQTHTHTKRNMS